MIFCLLSPALHKWFIMGLFGPVFLSAASLRYLVKVIESVLSICFYDFTWCFFGKIKIIRCWLLSLIVVIRKGVCLRLVIASNPFDVTYCKRMSYFEHLLLLLAQKGIEIDLGFSYWVFSFHFIKISTNYKSIGSKATVCCNLSTNIWRIGLAFKLPFSVYGLSIQCNESPFEW